MSRGRPRNFDPQEGLDKALHVFWAKGFANTSLSDLTAAMGINKPSLYGTYGDKLSLYRQCMQRYGAHYAQAAMRVLEQAPTPQEAIAGFLKGMVHLLTAPQHPGGCFVVTGAIACGSGTLPAELDGELTEGLRATAHMLTTRLQRDQALGRLPALVDCDLLGHSIATTLIGLAVQARAGESADRLLRVVDDTLRRFAAITPEPDGDNPQ